MNRLVGFLLLNLLLYTALTTAKPLSKEQVPEPLKPWIAWVTQDNPELYCPFLYNNPEQKRCSWPTGLALNLSAQEGRFSQRWQVYKDSWVSLPGDSQYWPQQVTVNGQAAVVLDKDGVPSIKLEAGAAHLASYDIKGVLFWDKLPDNLTLPADTGLLEVSINGKALALPAFNGGQLWLKDPDQQAAQAGGEQNALSLQVFRKLTDDVPMQVQTRLQLDVSGEPREIKLSNALLPNFIPLQVQSPLPARLEPDGQLTVQIRPGQWQVDIWARSTAAPASLAMPAVQPDGPDSELWVFEARPDLRVVDITQPDTIDASQTTLPDEWRNLPAYKMTAGQNLVFTVIRRGDPEPEPNQLSIHRTLWLDFDGTGYTANDRINGTMTHGWRLNALPGTQLGKVTLDGNNQLITLQTQPDQQGVEVRKGQLDLVADSRVTGAIADISAVGWAQTFHQASAELNLPPGWRLLAATGVDNVPDSWLSRWTLLDLFVVLITALATARLWSYRWGLLALLALVLLWHESGAPQFVWLNILAAKALLGVLPQGRFCQMARWYRNSAWLALVVIVLPFMVSQVRTGIYPQLEYPWLSIQAEPQDAANMATLTAMPAVVGMAARDAAAPVAEKAKRAAPQSAAEVVSDYYGSSAAMLERVDPKAKVQTGPGLPQWQWQKVYLSWNGAVTANQQLGLWYLSPPMTLALNFLRVALLAVLCLLMLGQAERWTLRPRSVAPLLWLLCLLPLVFAAVPDTAVADDYPSEAMLNELKTRLQETEAPDCLPSCAQISLMAMTINAQTITIDLQIHALAAVSVPLPADAKQWFPSLVSDNGKAATALSRNDGQLWINVAKGQHQVVLSGPAPLLGKFTLPLPLKPYRVTVAKSGWEVTGLQENGWTDEQLQFTRSQSPTDARQPTLQPGALPPFVRVERTLLLGLDWRVITQVSRLSPADTAVVLELPLLAGEAVISSGIRVKDHAVAINMPAQQLTMQWESTLEKAPQIVLTAPATEHWIEVWKADVSPIWHIEPSGIAMIHLNSAGLWLPEWHPWPGETVTLAISRPPALAGQTLTIDNSLLTITPGQRVLAAQLSFSLRSSQGTQHTLSLPDNAVLQSVSINGQAQPLRQQGQKITVPINPGKQEVSLSWQQDTAISPVFSTPVVGLGLASVNSKVALNLGQDRWILWVAGPRMGPAVLFWGVLVVLTLLALGLGKIPLTPLKPWQWWLLLVGLSQLPLFWAGVVIAWLMALGWRNNHVSLESRHFNAVQMGLAALTLLALAVLFAAVAQGLLSTPDMQITGNQSSAFNLNWYQDRSAESLPTATVVSVPLMAYRLLMLAWALWLAVSLLNWLSWGWACFAHTGLWHKTVKVVPAPVAPDDNDGAAG